MFRSRVQRSALIVLGRSGMGMVLDLLTTGRSGISIVLASALSSPNQPSTYEGIGFRGIMKLDSEHIESVLLLTCACPGNASLSGSLSQLFLVKSGRGDSWLSGRYIESCSGRKLGFLRRPEPGWALICAGRPVGLDMLAVRGAAPLPSIWRKSVGAPINGRLLFGLLARMLKCG